MIMRATETKSKAQINQENKQLILETNLLSDKEKGKALLMLRCGIPVNLESLIQKLRG